MFQQPFVGGKVVGGTTGPPEQRQGWVYGNAVHPVAAPGTKLASQAAFVEKGPFWTESQPLVPILIP